MSRRQILIGCVFVAGCVAGGVTSQVIAPVPPAHATSLPRWEYYCFRVSGPDPTAQQLTNAGKEGWEMVSSRTVVSHYDLAEICMKRPRG